MYDKMIRACGHEVMPSPMQVVRNIVPPAQDLDARVEHSGAHTCAGAKVSSDGVAKGAVGFTVSLGLDESAARRQAEAHRRALRHFPWLHHAAVEQGASSIELWSHEVPDRSLHHSEDGCLYILVGSPVGRPVWSTVLAQLRRQGDDRFELPWEGRVVLIRVTPDGREWTMWNDWNGSIPVFHAAVGDGRVASTLEPVVVATAGFTPNDFCLPGLASLLINGHFLGDWTLFENMKAVPPDCVAHWNGGDFRSTPLETIQPCDARWDRNWDELVDEMYELSRAAMVAALEPHASWTLPLSGGLDSRLVGAVGVDMGLALSAYTYGPPTWDETIFARQVAKVLKISWKRIDLGTQYLARYTRTWADWFGSALHFHGMYQMPFLDHLRSQPPAPLLQGYLGDPLAGNHVAGMLATHNGRSRDGIAMKGDLRWGAGQLPSLVRGPMNGAVEAVNERIEREIDGAPGSRFQQLMLFDLRSRQRLFVYYQPMMYDYWCGVATPYFDRAYAQFCFSLSQEALTGRKLQLDMIRRHYPALASVGGTFRRVPMNPTRSWEIRARIAWRLPAALRMGPLREFNMTPNTLEPDCVRATGRAAVWPITETREQLAEWFDVKMIEDAFQNATDGGWTAVNQLKSVQAVALRTLSEHRDS